MFIKKIVIEGVEGDVAISRTETGAVVTANPGPHPAAGGRSAPSPPRRSRHGSTDDPPR